MRAFLLCFVTWSASALACCPAGMICNSVAPNDMTPCQAGIINPPSDSPGALAPAVISSFEPFASTTAQSPGTSAAGAPNYAKCESDRVACGYDKEDCYRTYLQCIGNPYGKLNGECVNAGGAVLYVNGSGRLCTVCPTRLQDVCGFALTAQERYRFDGLPKWTVGDYHGNANDGPCQGCPARF